jgi:hypothetical protein
MTATVLQHNQRENMCISNGHSLRKYTILGTWKGSLQTRHGVTNIHLEFSVPWGKIWTWKIVIKLGRRAVRRFPAICCLSVLRRSPTAFLLSVCRAVVAIRMETFKHHHSHHAHCRRIPWPTSTRANATFFDLLVFGSTTREIVPHSAFSSVFF